jgi:two-component system response regulator HydG
MNVRPRIAVIDDDPTWAETLAEFLDAKGLDVYHAADARHGLDLLEHSGISVAVIDFHMPDLDGLELLRLIRQRLNSVVVVLMSSTGDPLLPRRVVEAGALAFLPKTAAPSRLVQAVQEALGRSRQLAEENLRRHFWNRLLTGPRRSDEKPAA